MGNNEEEIGRKEYFPLSLYEQHDNLMLMRSCIFEYFGHALVFWMTMERSCFLGTNW